QRLARVDAHDAAFGNGGCDDTGIGEAGHIELGGIFGCAGDFGAAVDAGCGGADVSRHELPRSIVLLRSDRRRAPVLMPMHGAIGWLTGPSCWTATAACRARPGSARERCRGAPARS